MNQFFYETRGKEKDKDLMEEVMRSQALRNSQTGRWQMRIFNGLPLKIITLAGISGLLTILGN